MSRRKRRRPTRASKLIAKRARWMRNGSSTVHESITDFILRDIAKGQNLTVKNQKIFHDEIMDKWYITDFYIPELSLVIEIDGKHHSKEDQIAYDNIRTNFLERIGNKVVRVKNDEIESLEYRDSLINILKDAMIDRATGIKGDLPRVHKTLRKANRSAYYDWIAYKTGR